MFASILRGEKATDLFKRLTAAHPQLTNSELASQFMDYFQSIDGEARQVIWHWQRPGKAMGLCDNDVNESLQKMLRDAGYAVQSK